MYEIIGLKKLFYIQISGVRQITYTSLFIFYRKIRYNKKYIQF